MGRSHSETSKKTVRDRKEKYGLNGRRVQTGPADGPSAVRPMEPDWSGAGSPVSSSTSRGPRQAGPVAVRDRLRQHEGSQHGFAVHDDPQYLNPTSQEYQAHVIRAVSAWLMS